MALVMKHRDETWEYESSSIDFTTMVEGVESVVECIHKTAYEELLSRTIDSMWGWEVRTKHMFEHNLLHRVGDVIACQLNKVNRLIGCGYKTRKEVYDVFCMYHLRLKHWSPELHWKKQNYKF